MLLMGAKSMLRLGDDDVVLAGFRIGFKPFHDLTINSRKGVTKEQGAGDPLELNPANL